MQTMTTIVNGEVRSLNLPSPGERLAHGGHWGRFDELFTPAFWRGQAWQHQLVGAYEDNRLGRSLSEELAACMLGGFGMPAAMGLAAFARLRERGLIFAGVSEGQLHEALVEPLSVDGRARKYRFPRQKAHLLAAALRDLGTLDASSGDRQLRDKLTRLPGIGPKTASWIVRNVRCSDAVAILDVHIVRAGRLAGVFPAGLTPERHYPRLEELFLAFAVDIGVPASMLDALMWDYMRRLPLALTQAGLKADDSDADAAPAWSHAQGVADLAA
jgi:thermostable 8-oxoguanine DNA glycosylase